MLSLQLPPRKIIWISASVTLYTTIVMVLFQDGVFFVWFGFFLVHFLFRPRIEHYTIINVRKLLQYFEINIFHHTTNTTYKSLEKWSKTLERFTGSLKYNKFSSCPCSPAPLLLQTCYLRTLRDKEKICKCFSPDHFFEQYVTFQCIGPGVIEIT